MTRLTEPTHACTACHGSGKVPNRAVSKALLVVAGVRTTVRQPCPSCAGTATLLAR